MQLQSLFYLFLFFTPHINGFFCKTLRTCCARKNTVPVRSILCYGNIEFFVARHGKKNILAAAPLGDRQNAVFIGNASHYHITDLSIKEGKLLVSYAEQYTIDEHDLSRIIQELYVVLWTKNLDDEAYAIIPDEYKKAPRSRDACCVSNEKYTVRVELDEQCQNFQNIMIYPANKDEWLQRDNFFLDAPDGKVKLILNRSDSHTIGQNEVDAMWFSSDGTRFIVKDTAGHINVYNTEDPFWAKVGDFDLPTHSQF